MDKVKEIEERFNRGYTNTIYENRYEIHKQMNKDIETLLIICSSSLQLKDRYKIDFNFWLTKKFVKQGDLYYPINGSMLMSENEVMEIYKDEVLDL